MFKKHKNITHTAIELINETEKQKALKVIRKQLLILEQLRSQPRSSLPSPLTSSWMWT